MKNFDQWNSQKKNLENGQYKKISFHEREIWWCSLGVNLGDEEDGKNEFFERPILILKKFNRRVVWAIPMTSQEKEGVHYYPIVYKGRISSLLLSQLRLISTKRFRRFVGKISPKQQSLIKAALVNLLLN